MFILQGLPNVGPARAQALLGRFGSVGGVVAAGVEGLAEADGIGETVAVSIVRALGPEPVVESQDMVSAFRR